MPELQNLAKLQYKFGIFPDQGLFGNSLPIKGHYRLMNNSLSHFRVTLSIPISVDYVAMSSELEGTRNDVFILSQTQVCSVFPSRSNLTCFFLILNTFDRLWLTLFCLFPLTHTSPLLFRFLST